MTNTNPSTPLIAVSHLVKQYGPHPVLKDLNLTIYPGEIYGFIGHNGAGKSTTMQLIMGLLKANSGTITRAPHLHATNLGYLPESPEFFPYMSAVQYLRYIGETGGQSKIAIQKRSHELLAMVDLEQKAHHPIGGYSRGMKQRLGLAVALYHNPELLLLDEPSSALDPMGRQAVVKILAQLKAQGKTIFLSTHILDDIERICDRIGVLHGGHLALEGPLSHLLESAGGQGIVVTFTEEASELEIQSFCRACAGQIAGSWSLIEPKVVLFTTGLNTAMHFTHLLQVAATAPTIVQGVHKQQATLEDLYMKVVNT